MNHIKNLVAPVMLIGILAVALAFSGCREETGCTTRTSDNYNPDAVRDDGSCINARDKFLGVYNILHICWPDTLLPTPRFMTIAEDQLREQEDDIKMLNFGDDSILVRALIDQHDLIIPMQSLSVRGIPMTFRGEGHIDDDGYLTILYSTWLMNGQQIKEDCVIFAQRYDN
ncbi:MAG: hypothetical protein K9J17_17020 [Flavobacteriales bacterium]|nr:hypothetical protein [Flavobacteriales bacterium]